MGIRQSVLIDPGCAGLETPGDRSASLDVAGPDGAAQSIPCVVCPADRIFDIRIAYDWENGTERLFINQTRSLFDIRDNRGGDEVSGPIQRISSRQYSHGQPLRVFQKAEHFLILHLVLDGSHLNVGIQTITDLHRVRQIRQFLTEQFVDAVVDVEPLDCKADLAAVGERRPEDVARDFGGFGIIENLGNSPALRDQEHHIGPAIFTEIALSKDLKITPDVGLLFGLTSSTPDVALKLNIGVPLHQR